MTYITCTTVGVTRLLLQIYAQSVTIGKRSCMFISICKRIVKTQCDTWDEVLYVKVPQIVLSTVVNFCLIKWNRGNGKVNTHNNNNNSKRQQQQLLLLHKIVERQQRKQILLLLLLKATKRKRQEQQKIRMRTTTTTTKNHLHQQQQQQFKTLRQQNQQLLLQQQQAAIQVVVVVVVVRVHHHYHHLLQLFPFSLQHLLLLSLQLLLLNPRLKNVLFLKQKNSTKNKSRRK